MTAGAPDLGLDLGSLDYVTLVARKACPVCEGVGARRSDEWAAFDEWREQHGPHRGRMADADAAIEHYFLSVMGYVSVPPERTECGNCDGTGKVDTEITVALLVSVVLEHVRRPVLSSDELEALVGQVRRAVTHAATASQGLTDGMEMGTWLRAVQEGAEAMRSLGELQAQPKDAWDV